MSFILSQIVPNPSPLPLTHKSLMFRRPTLLLLRDLHLSPPPTCCNTYRNYGDLKCEYLTVLPFFFFSLSFLVFLLLFVFKVRTSRQVLMTTLGGHREPRPGVDRDTNTSGPKGSVTLSAGVWTPGRLSRNESSHGRYENPLTSTHKDRQLPVQTSDAYLL